MKTNKDNQILKRGQDALAARCSVGAARERVGYEPTSITKSLLISQLHTPKCALRKTSIGLFPLRGQGDLCRVQTRE